jgi:hypothetical protein
MISWWISSSPGSGAYGMKLRSAQSKAPRISCGLDTAVISLRSRSDTDVDPHVARRGAAILGYVEVASCGGPQFVPPFAHHRAVLHKDGMESPYPGSSMFVAASRRSASPAAEPTRLQASSWIRPGSPRPAAMVPPRTPAPGFARPSSPDRRLPSSPHSPRPHCAARGPFLAPSSPP